MKTPKPMAKMLESMTQEEYLAYVSHQDQVMLKNTTEAEVEELQQYRLKIATNKARIAAHKAKIATNKAKAAQKAADEAQTASKEAQEANAKVISLDKLMQKEIFKNITNII